MSMYLGRIHVRASLPVNYGLLYWAFISGLHVINKWKMCYEFQKNVFRTINSMRYVRYGALNNRTVQRLPKHCVCRSNNTFIQPTDEIYYWLYIENSSSSNQGWGCNRSSKQARRVKTRLSLPNQTSAIITKGLPKMNKCMHQTK